MYDKNIPRASNRADWIETIEITDGDTGQLIDLEEASLLLEVRHQQTRCEPILSASTSNGKITVIELGRAQFVFPRSEMLCVCPSTYDVGLTVERDGITEQLIIATVAIVDGIVRK